MRPSKINKNLEKFKNIHANKTAMLFATGPSLNKFKEELIQEEVVCFGLNKIYSWPDIAKKLKYYYFGSEYNTVEEHRQRVNNLCKNQNLIKFASAYEDGRSHKDINRGNITPEQAIEIGAIPFENTLSHFTHNPSKYCTKGHSIVFPAMQHILFMGFRKIYLVGCDGGYGNGKSSGEPELVSLWETFRKFKENAFPSVKIISVNPVSLAGMFDEDIRA